MKHFNPLYALLLLAGIAAGCVNEKPSYGTDDTTPATEIGYIDLNGLAPQVLLDSEVNPLPIVKNSATRAVTEAGGEYIVRIYNSSNEAVLDTTYGELQSQLTDGPDRNLLALPTGNYRLYVCSHADEAIKDVEWEDPVYGTEYEFSIQRAHTSDNPQTIDGNIICKLSNIKVTVTMSADLAEVLSDDTQSTVSLNEVSTVFSKTESRPAFFRPQAGDGNGDTLQFLLTGQKDGKPVQLNKTITGVKAGQWRKISLSIVYSETGEIEIGVTVNNFVQDEEIPVNSTESMWEPVLDEPSGLPELIWPDHELSEGVSVSDAMYDQSGEFTGTAPVLTLNAPNAIQSVLATLTTDNAAFRSEVIESGGLTDVDLCGTISRLNPFRTLQLTAGATESTLDLSSIMWIFYGYSGKHTLTFHMTDAKGQDAEASLTFTYAGGGAAEAPTIVWKQGNIDEPQTVTDGMEIDIDVTAPAGIKNFVITINSEVLAPALIPMELDKPFDLCNVTSPTQAEYLETFGFPINEAVKGTSSQSISITPFVSLLSGFPGTHSFELSVTDNNGSNVTKTLTLIVEGE